MPAWLERIVQDAHQALVTDPRAAPARAYLAGRKVPQALLDVYRLGFLLPDQPILECTEAFQRWNWALPNRLLFPLTSTQGETVGIQTRPLDTKAYAIFEAYPRGLHPVCFGMREAISAIWDTRAVILTEGAFDALAVRTVAPNVIALLTAKVQAATHRFLRRYVTAVVALMDMDQAGRAAALRLQQASQNRYAVATPEYSAHDPGELLEQGRLADLQRIVRPPSFPCS